MTHLSMQNYCTIVFFYGLVGDRSISRRPEVLNRRDTFRYLDLEIILP